ncbi:hypothetical protein GIB67_042170 [Kingdonia uniflora]|uniref:Aminotransferase-like plant mobile domain-containing protein n=1 Tax=Kingdonia uniflora TaxID=39325 RepID=A0A7J7NWS9_9MAGN|nr:hypothetical protein GIB67_042170 [Kingdonia uniflora]
MTPTLDDVEQLVGLPAYGDATIIDGTWGFPAILKVFENILLQDLNAFNSLKVGGTGNSLSLRKLKEYYAYKLEKVLSDSTAAAAKKKKGLTVRSVARAYILYVLGSLPFPTKMGTGVSARYLYLFAKDKVAKKWSWGSAVLAYMYYNLGVTSQDDGTQFACYSTLLESWIFAYFPKLTGIPKEIDSDAYEYCTCWKWDVSVTDRYGGTALLKFREALDNYKLDDFKESESLKVVNVLLMEQIDLQLLLATPRQKLVNAEERMKPLEEVLRQALKKTLVSEGMKDMGDPTFEELFEQNERFFTIAQQGPKGDYQEDLVSTVVTLENVVIAMREKMAKKMKIQELLFQP